MRPARSSPARCGRVFQGLEYLHDTQETVVQLHPCLPLLFAASPWTGPILKQTSFEGFAHSLCDDQPRGVGHVSSGQVAANAAWDHICFGVPTAVVHPVQRHTGFAISTIGTAFGDQLLNEGLVEIVFEADFSVRFSTVHNDVVLTAKVAFTFKFLALGFLAL